MTDTERSSREQGQAVEDSGHAFEQITALILEINGQIRGITRQLEAMCSERDSVIARMTDIDGASEQVAARMEDFRSFSGAQDRMMQKVNSCSGELEKLTRNLKQQMERLG